MPDDPPIQSDTQRRNEFFRLLDSISDARMPYRSKWNRSALNQDAIEYIIQRENLMESLQKLHQVSWQNINPDNRELAQQIKENAIDSVMILLDAMRRIELNYL